MIRLRQDLLDEQDYKSAIRDLVEQLNRVLGESAGDPYSFEGKPLDDELKITSVTEEPTASDRVKVTIVTEAHSFLYECRYKTEMEPSWRRWIQADNVFTFEVDPCNWIAQLRVRRSPDSNWSTWATARGSGEAIAAESTDDVTELTITPPPTPTATATYRGIRVTWGVVEWSGLAQFLVYKSTTPNFDDAQLVASVIGPVWTDVNVEEGTTYYYWVRAQHKRGFISRPAGPASATARKIISDDLYDQIIKETHVASDLRFVKVVDTLPSLPNDNYPQGSIVFLTSDNKLYRSTGSSWTCMIPTSDLYGLISTEQIQDYAIEGIKIAAGAVSLLKFADGIRPIQVVSSLPSLPHSDYPQGAVVFLSTDNKLYRSTGTSWTAAVPTLDLVGQITTDQIEDSSITASKIRNASIEETKLAAGAVSLTKFADGIRPIQLVSTLPTLPHTDYPQGAVVFLTTENKLYRSTGSSWTAVVPTTDLAGQITSAQIEDGSITDLKIASGAVSLTKFASGLRPVQLVSSLPSLPNSNYPQGAVVFLTTENKLYRSTGTSWVASVPTSDLSGQITTSQIEDGAITASKLLNGSVTELKIASGAVSLTKFADNLRPIQLVSSLPSLPDSNYPQGAVVFLTTENKLYRSTGTSWVASVPTSDLTGQITETQIANDSISTPKIKSNAIEGYHIKSNSISSAHIQSDAIEAGHIKAGAVGTDELAAEAVTAQKIKAGEVYASKLNVAQVFVDGLAVSNNTPSSGHISWSAHTIYYQGTGYSISSGSTNNRYIYWNVGDASLSTSNTKPSWASNRFMIMINDAGVHRLVWNATLIHGGAILTGTITADEIAANSITSGHIQSDAIEAGHIRSGAVGTDELAAEAVTAQKLKAGEVYASKLNVAQIFVDGLSISDNTPSAGSVSWTSHTIYYQGTAYSISSGSTSAKYIYWDVGNSSLSTASTKPSWSSTRFMIAINDGGYCRIVWNATYIHGGTIVSNSITADEIAANSITVSKLSPEARMVFADTFDGIFDWSKWGTGEVSIVSSGDAITGGKILRVGDNSGDDTVYLIHRALIPYDPNCIYRIRVRFRRVAGDGSFYAGFAGVAGDGTTFVNINGQNAYLNQHYHAASGLTSDSWYLAEGYTSGVSNPGQGTAGTLTQPGTMHVNTRYLRPAMILNSKAGGTSGITDVDMFAVEIIPNQVSMWAHGNDVTKIDGGEIYTRSITASQIASGTITANEIAAGTITAANIQSRSITGDRLVVGAISGAEIAADAIEANHIKGGSIYASKLNVAQIFVSGLSMSNNSPSNGYVSWNSHVIYFEGTGYSISSGNTAYKYIYWNVGNNFLSASNTKPDWSPTRFMIAINNSGIHSLVWNATIIHGGAIVTGSITADEIAANAIVAGKIAAGAVGTNQLAADSVVGDKIASNQIASRHIVTEGLVAVPIRTASNGPRVEIFPDENTGLAIWAPNEQLAMSVFTGQSGGFGPGDIYVGSAAAGKYMYWSASDQVLNVRGRIEADNINGFDSEDFGRAIANALGLDDFSLSWEDVYNAPVSSDYSLGSFTNINFPSTCGSDDTQAIEIVNNKLNLRRGYVVAQRTVTGLTWNVGDGVGDPPLIMTKVSVAHGTVLTGFALRLKRVGPNESKTATARIWTYLNGEFTSRASTTVYLKDLPTSSQEVMFWMGSDYTYDSAHGELYIGITTSNTYSGTYIVVTGGVDSGGTLYKFGSFVSGKSLYYKLKKRVQTSGKRAWYVFSSPINLSSYTRLKLSLQSPVNLSGKVQLYIQNGTTDQYINFPSMVGNNASEFVIFDISSTGRNSVGRIGFKALQDMEDDYVVSLSLLEAMTPNEKVTTRAPWDPSTHIYVATEREIRPAANAIIRCVSATSLKVIFPFFPDWIPVDLTWSTSYTTGKYHVQMRKGITGQPTASDFLISSSIDSDYDLVATLYHQNGTGFVPFYMPSPREVVYANNGFRVLTNGQATSWTNVSLASYVPTGRCVVARLRVSTADSRLNRVILRSPVLQETRETYLHYTGQDPDYPFTWGIEEILTDTSGNIQYTKYYLYSGVTLDLLGYKDWEK